MDKKEMFDNWKDVSDHLINIIGDSFICYHIPEGDWGTGSILIMEKNGNAFARTYWHINDKNTIYFDWLSVDEKERGNGIASKLIDSHIQVANHFKVASKLFVKKNSWMHDWYKKKGYIDSFNYNKEGTYIWMILK